MSDQGGWRFCAKCHTMFFDGFPDNKGVCPASASHDAQGFIFNIPFDIPQSSNAQGGWRNCSKCQAMFFDGFPDNKGVCPAGASHAAAGPFFVPTHDIPETPNAQGAWRNCSKCQAMFFDGFPDSVCPTGAGHAAAGPFFVLPHDLPNQLDFGFNPIVFGTGIPVGGFAHLTIHSDGTYNFTGHFHDSGADEFNTALAWVVKDFLSHGYSFAHSGHVAGTFESGSRNDDWNNDGQNDAIKDNWFAIAAADSASAKAEVNADLTNLINTVIGIAGTTLGVVAIIIA
jgi:hypothetical protein